jgi:regulatory protein
VSDAAESPQGDPTDDALPDLFGGASGWDEPLADLAAQADEQPQVPGAGGAGAEGREPAASGPAVDGPGPGPGGAGMGGRDPAPSGEGSGGDGPDAGGVGPAPLTDLAGPGFDAPLADLAAAPPGGDDLWAPAPLPDRADAEEGHAPEPLTDLTRGRRRGRRARRGGGGATPEGERGGAASTGRSGRPRVPGVVAARDLVRDPDVPSGEGAGLAADPAAAAAGAPDREDAPRGLATGGLAGGLEPGTLFGPDGAAAPPTTGRRRRRGRRARPDPNGGPDGAAAAPERPLTAEERLQHALTLAYRHLSKRDRTVSEVRAHLEGRAVDEPSIAGALKELVEFGYLDDERYAARFVEDKRRLEGWGHLRIAEGLRRTGVPRELADRAVADDPLRGEEADLAVETLEQRLAGRAPADDRARQKALRLLATKGYPLETAYAAVRTYERRCAERAGD